MNNQSDKNLITLTVEDFCVTTASEAPTPGGGSISALLGALGAALSEMVSRLSLDASEQKSEEIKQITTKAARLRIELLNLIEEDSRSFDAVMAAFHLPKQTENQKAFRKAKIQEGLKQATLSPFQIACKASEVFPLADILVRKGNPNALSDVMIAAMCAETAIFGAGMNVRINLSSIKDPDFVNEYLNRMDELENAARHQKETIVSVGYSSDKFPRRNKCQK